MPFPFITVGPDSHCNVAVEALAVLSVPNFLQISLVDIRLVLPGASLAKIVGENTTSTFVVTYLSTGITYLMRTKNQSIAGRAFVFCCLGATCRTLSVSTRWLKDSAARTAGHA